MKTVIELDRKEILEIVQKHFADKLEVAETAPQVTFQLERSTIMAAALTATVLVRS